MADRHPDRRGQVIIRTAQALLVVAAAGLWAASRLPWVVLRSFDGLGAPKTTMLSGAVWSEALVPLALLLLATAVAAVAVRGWPLRVLALLVAVASLATGHLAISLWTIRDVAVRGADLAHVPVRLLVGSGRCYPGSAITLVAAVCMLFGTVLLMRAAPLARGKATKYLTPAARRSLTIRNDEIVSERMIWDALDDGWDPTQDQSDQPCESPAPPDREEPHDADIEGR
ncbi:MAG: TIGR02234 family membrane protein [Mycobacterium sp.]|nr:TIGR02234 family membrane protein [Mycobacterium sp.]